MSHYMSHYKALYLALYLAWALILVGVIALIAGACSDSPTPTPTPTAAATPTPTPTAAPASTPTPPPAPGAPGIVDPQNRGWPRQVEVKNGIIEIKEKPMRVHTLSVGYDEITFALVDPSRIAAVGTSAANPNYSNIADLAGNMANQISRDAEQIISVNPDLVVASNFTKTEVVQLLEQAGITVVQPTLASSLDAHEDNIRLIAYMYGEEERGEELIEEVRARLERITDVASAKAESERPWVMFLSGRNNTRGQGTIQDGIIRAAGGINVAAEAGIEGGQEISLEVIVEYAPEYIFIYSGFEGEVEDKMKELTAHPALVNVPAIRDNRIIGVSWPYFNTLSHWNIRGIEELAKVLWPQDFGDVEFEDFRYDAG